MSQTTTYKVERFMEGRWSKLYIPDQDVDTMTQLARNEAAVFKTPTRVVRVQTYEDVVFQFGIPPGEGQMEVKSV